MIEGRIPVHEATLVVDSYGRVEARSAELRRAFFTSLFNLQPGLEKLFPPLDEDKRAFAATFFRFVVKHLESEEAELSELLERLGKRGLIDHLTFAERDSIGESILTALREVEGLSWSTQTSHAWETAYGWTWATILRGAKSREHH